VNERIVVVIPIRSLRNGKTRLAPVLGPDARAALLRAAAGRVVEATVASGIAESILVVSPDAEALAWAAARGAAVVPLAQPAHHPGLNGSIEAGREWALARGADAILSLFGDLPLLAADDLVSLAAHPEEVVLGADRRGEGTNALLLRLSGRGAEFHFAFGEGSLARHLAEAHRLGLDAAVHEAAGTAFDLDTPVDWGDYLDLADAPEPGAPAGRPLACEAGRR
jgi:2-phospho-L-lactate guanylyltransferase